MSPQISSHGPSLSDTLREGGHVIEMQRRRLLLAMQELAGEQGLAKATVGAVCKRSRISRRTFYDLFADREACFLAAFEQALAELGERVLPAYEHGGRWRDRIRAGLECLLAVFDEQPALARLCVVETLKGGPAVLERRRELLDMLAVAVDGGRAEARAGAGLPALTAESVVGGVLAVIHARLVGSPAAGRGISAVAGSSPGPLAELSRSLSGMVVLPYLGQAASQRELERASPTANRSASSGSYEANGEPACDDPFADLRLRFTYRTARVLATIEATPGASNRMAGEGAGVADQGQISKLLKRLERAGLLENGGAGRESGAPNVWRLTARGRAVHNALGVGSPSA